MRSMRLLLFLSCCVLAGRQSLAREGAAGNWMSLEEFEGKTVEVLEVGGRLVSGRLADVTQTFVLVDRKGAHGRVERARVHRVTSVRASTRQRNTLIGLAIGVGGMGALAYGYIKGEHSTVPVHGLAAALAVGAAGGSAVGYLTSSPESRNVIYEPRKECPEAPQP